MSHMLKHNIRWLLICECHWHTSHNTIAILIPFSLFQLLTTCIWFHRHSSCCGTSMASSILWKYIVILAHPSPTFRSFPCWVLVASDVPLCSDHWNIYANRPAPSIYRTKQQNKQLMWDPHGCQSPQYWVPCCFAIVNVYVQCFVLFLLFSRDFMLERPPPKVLNFLPQTITNLSQ